MPINTLSGLIGQGKMDNIRTDRQQWISKYAERMLNNYLTWQSPLGIDTNYIEKIKQDLIADFEDPLRKSLIEDTY